MGFANPITGGEDLIRSGIRSPGFVSGSIGWRIAQDGSAEFNNVVVRGTLATGSIQGPVSITGDVTVTAPGRLILGASKPQLLLSNLGTIIFDTGDAAQTNTGYLAAAIQGSTHRQALAAWRAPILSSLGAVCEIDLVSASHDGVNPAQIWFAVGSLTNTAVMTSGGLSIGSSKNVPETLELHGSIAGVSFHGRDNDAQRAVIYLNTNLLRFWNGADRMWMGAAGDFHGSAVGNNGTFLEARGQSVLTGGGIYPNYVIECGTVVINFVGGNGNFSFATTFGAVVSVVVSEGGGFGDTVVGTTNYSGTAAGIYCFHAGATVSGLVRVNYVVFGS